MEVDRMPKVVDARGLKCPEPAIQVGKALKDNDKLTVIVDDKTSIPNISSAVGKRGFQVRVERKGDDYYLHIGKDKVEEGNGGGDSRSSYP
jgi:TusA-related sulfurtransferase